MLLRIENGPRRGDEIRLAEDGATTLGRDPGCPIALDDPKASRRHAVIEKTPAGWRLQDLGSANGTRIDGEMVSARVLRAGETILIGDTALLVVDLEGAGVPLREEPRMRTRRRSRHRAPERAPWGAALALLALAGGVVLWLGLRQKPAADTSTAANRGAAAVDLEAAAATPTVGNAGAPPRFEIPPPAEPAESRPPAAPPSVPPRIDPETSLAATRTAPPPRPTGSGENAEPSAAVVPPPVRPPPAASAAEKTLAEIAAEIERLRASTLAAESGGDGGDGQQGGSARSPEIIAAWHRFGEKLAKLVGAARQDPDLNGQRERLAELFVEVRLAALRLAPPARLFHARSAKLDGERVALTYDFQDASQLEDFAGVGPSSRAAIRGGRLSASGVVRLLGGEPFRGELRVRLEVPAGGYDRERPNINVALWTAESDELAPAGTMSLTSALRDVEPDAVDFVLFGCGYRAPVWDFGGTAKEELRPRGSQEFVPLPALALLCGRRGARLHAEAGECLWAAPLPAGEVRGKAVTTEVYCGPQGLSWRLGRRELLPRQHEALAAAAARLPRRGSVSIVALGGEVQIARLEVEGLLDPFWLEPRLERLARQELDEILR